MYDFMVDQLVGLNGLVNASNIVLLVAFSMRKVLWLRVLSIFSEALILPYYYLQHETLWPLIFWGLAFVTVNAVLIVAIALERRPVVFSDKEQQLYQVAFSSVDKREFLRLVSLVRWFDCSAGEMILEKGQPIPDAIVLISGNVEAIVSGETRVALRPGQLIGDASAYSGLASPMDVVARGPGRLAKWDLSQLREFTANRPELRATLLQIVSIDLGGKLRDAATAVSEFASARVTSELPPSCV
jgi:CRP-like cAMP-binding protein